MNNERIDFINKTIRMLNTIEGKLTDNRGGALEYIRNTRKKLQRKLEKNVGCGKEFTIKNYLFICNERHLCKDCEEKT